MVSAPAARNARTNTVSMTHTDRPVRACTCGRTVTSGLISRPLAIAVKIASKEMRMAVAIHPKKMSISLLGSNNRSIAASAPDDALDDLQQHRREDGQAVADQGVLERALG